MILLILYLILVYYFTNSFIHSLTLLYNYIITICDSSIANTKILSNIRDVFVNDNSLVYNGTTKFSSVLADNILLAKTNNDYVFSFYNNEKGEFNDNLKSSLDALFYSNMCNSTLMSIDCFLLNKNYTGMYYKGFKYSLNYYENMILQLIDYYEKNKYTKKLIDIYYEYNPDFVKAILANSYQFSEIYKVLINLLKTEFESTTNMFFIVILIISVLNTFFLIVSIYVRWEKYIDNIKLEEYMSEKLIAEIPLYIILKIKPIGDHLLDFASKNLR